MPYTAEHIRGLREQYDVAVRKHRRATDGADDELNADLDALTALLHDDELWAIGRYVVREGEEEPE